MKKILGRQALASVALVVALFGGDEISITTKASKNSVFVGEPFVVSVMISEKIGLSISGNRYEKPNFSGFLAKEAKNNTTTIENGFEKTQLNYLLIPQKAGSFNITPAKADVSVQNATQSIEFMGIVMQTSSPKVEHLISNSLSIAVKPAPANVDLIGNFNINQSVSATTVKANKPVVLTLKIDGDGAIDDIDNVDFSSDVITTYANKPVVSQKFTDTAIESSYQKEYIFVSDHNFTIPAKTITMFNPLTNKVTKKILPSHNIIVTGGAAKSNDEVISEKKEDRNDYGVWKYIIIGIILGSLATLATIFVRNKPNKKKTKIPANALSKLMPYVKSDKEVAKMVEMLYAKQKGEKNIKIDNKKLKQLLVKYESKIR